MMQNAVFIVVRTVLYRSPLNTAGLQRQTTHICAQVCTTVRELVPIGRQDGPSRTKVSTKWTDLFASAATDHRCGTTHVLPLLDLVQF